MIDEALLADELRELPPWRHAVKLFLEAGFKPGDVVTHEWLHEAFGLELPTPEMPCSKADPLRLEYMRQLEGFTNTLLEDHQIDITNKRGVGYIVVPSKDQSALAFKQGMHEIRQGMRKMVRRVANVDLASLTAEERKENAEAMARAAHLASMIRGTKRLPSPMELSED